MCVREEAKFKNLRGKQHRVGEVGGLHKVVCDACAYVFVRACCNVCGAEESKGYK